MEAAIKRYHHDMDLVYEDEDDGTIMADSQSVIIATCHTIIQLDNLMLEYTSKQLGKAEREAMAAIKRASGASKGRLDDGV